MGSKVAIRVKGCLKRSDVDGEKLRLDSRQRLKTERGWTQAGSRQKAGLKTERGWTQAGSRQREAGSRQREAGSRQREAGLKTERSWTQDREGLDSRQREVGLKTCRSLVAMS